MAIWIQVLLWAITNAPTIFKIVKEILELIKKVPRNEQSALKSEFKLAAKEAKVRRDFRPLYKLHRALRERNH